MARYQALGGTHLLLWKTIEEGTRDGLRELDLGRSDCDNSGLVTFKERWGATRHTMRYLRYPINSRPLFRSTREKLLVKRLFACMPNRLLATAGRLLYRHIG